MNSGTPHLLPNPQQQKQQQAAADAAVSNMVRGSAIRIYEQLCVAMVLANETSDPVTGEPASPELKPDEMMALAEQALYMAPFIYARLGMINSPVPQDDPRQ